MSESADRMTIATPCPSCGGVLVLGAAWSYPRGFVAAICEAEEIVFEIDDDEVRA